MIAVEVYARGHSKRGLRRIVPTLDDAVGVINSLPSGVTVVLTTTDADERLDGR